ncbi:cupin domain-containing protein [Glaciihabitans sp. INWT7]|uniref:cupin domain-containing protein n=1 Tax=Glaciihabitans sp. INWT7 TaxID=2596912 RepID=UPI001629D386|nr:cupin domain-containing protein [Glaciihabitans sp. INWT7]QNE45817.1 cupin domain-containing protein [Glaciihabitans sp. INWT7]
MASDLALRLKAARTDRGLSLRGVAAEIGVSAALISQIELGHTQPSVSTLYALVNFFGISLDQVMGLPLTVSRVPGAATDTGAPGRAEADALASGARLEHRASGARPILEIGNGVRWELVASAPLSLAEAVLVTYEPGASSSSDGSLMTHPGSENAYLVAGELDLELEDSTVKLRAGDSFSFDPARPHRFHNSGVEPASGIWLKVSGEV